MAGSPRLISMWSGPRNVSTAMMYSWRQRSDTEVVDEPWYAHYLSRSGVEHPGADEVLGSQPTDVDEVVARLLSPSHRPVRFLKNMAHHLQGLDRSVLDLSDNFLLVRDPREMLPSLRAGLGRVPTMDQTGLELQAEVFDHLIAKGASPPVVMAGSLLANPRRVLEALCGALDLELDEAMLSWPAGPKPEDGVWARHWYARAHESTGFGRPEPRAEPVDQALADLLDRCRPIYERLAESAL